MNIIKWLKQSMLVWHVSVAFWVQVLGYGITFLLNILLARWLGLEQYGSFIFFKNIVTIVGLFGTVGLFGSATKYLPSYKTSSKVTEIWAFVIFSTVLTTVISGFLAGITSLILINFPPDELDTYIFLPFIPIIIVVALVALYADILRGLQYVFEALAPIDLIRPLMMLMLMMLMPALLDIHIFIVSLWAFTISTILVGLYQLSIIVLTLFKKKPQGLRFQIREWLSFGLESLFYHGTIMIRTELMPVIVAYILAGRDVGLLVVAERASYITAFLFNAARRVFEPMIAPLYENGDLDELNRIHIRITRWTFYASLSISLIILIFADYLLRLFGEGFLAARPLLIIMLVGQVVNSATGQAGSILRFTGHEGLVRKIMTYTTVLMLLLTIALTSFIGIVGTAIGVTSGVIVQNIAFYLALRQKLGLTLPLESFFLVESSKKNV